MICVWKGIFKITCFGLGALSEILITFSSSGVSKSTPPLITVLSSWTPSWVVAAKIGEVKNNDGHNKGYKVTVPDSNDENRVISIPDGIYSMLENHSTNYTVMSNANAETKVSGKLPRKDAFKKRKAGVINLKDNGTNVIELTDKIDERDH